MFAVIIMTLFMYPFQSTVSQNKKAERTGLARRP